MNYMIQHVIYANNTVRLIHMNLQVENFQRCTCAFYQHQAWVKLQLALFLPLLKSFSSTISYFSSSSNQQLTCWLNASPWCQLLYLLYFSRYCTVRFKIFSLFLCLFLHIVYFYILLYVIFIYYICILLLLYVIYNILKSIIHLLKCSTICQLC